MNSLFIGQIMMWGGNFAPQGWAFCDGQLLDIASHTALFSILGTNYGGDGQTTFGLPDFRGRVPIHAGQGPGLSSYPLGQKGGSETISLTTSQIPSHQHDTSDVPILVTVQLRASSNPGSQSNPSGNYLANSGNFNLYTTDLLSATTLTARSDLDLTMSDNMQNTGSNQGHENRAPYLPISFVIALTGPYPVRS